MNQDILKFGLRIVGLAASLYDILSDEQITKLLDGIKNGKLHDHAFNSKPDNQPKHKKYTAPTWHSRGCRQHLVVDQN